MNCFVIMHNIIIKSQRVAQVEDDQAFDFQGPLAQVNDVSAKFSPFLTMKQEIRNRDEHNRLQEDLVEYLWTRRGNAQ
jgi:hypothetical protein